MFELFDIRHQLECDVVPAKQSPSANHKSLPGQAMVFVEENDSSMASISVNAGTIIMIIILLKITRPDRHRNYSTNEAKNQ